MAKLGLNRDVAIRGMGQVFRDFAELSDFIFDKVGDSGGHVMPQAETMMELARQGKNGPNDLPSVWLKRVVMAIREEVNELDESIAWKWHRPDRTDLQNVRVEIVDIFHFLIMAAIVSGMDGEDFARVFYEKWELNFKRQSEGFKPDDNKAIGSSLGD